jgi:hypothetical protein
MSHVAMQETKPGEPMFADMEALHLAAVMCGGRIVERNTYHWYNRHVGDYPVPKGVKVEQLGKNAKYVFEILPEKYKELGITGKPYDLGLIEDPANPGCLVPIYDFYDGGMGLDNAIGTPLFSDAYQKAIKMLCPKLKQNYDIACDILAAKQAGDNIDVLTAKEASIKYPNMFPESNDTNTWVSIVTGNRLNNMQG